MKRYVFLIPLICVLTCVLFVSVVAAEPPNPSFEHLKKKLEPYTKFDVHNEEKFKRKKAVKIIENYISKHRGKLSDREIVKMYHLIAAYYTWASPLPREDMKADKYALKGESVGGIKLTPIKIDLLGFLEGRENKVLSSEEGGAGFHQFHGFLSIVQGWFLRYYTMPDRKKETGRGQKDEVIRKLRERGFSPRVAMKVLTNFKKWSADIKNKIKAMYLPYVYLSESKNVEDSILASSVRKPAFYRRKLKKQSLTFNRERINTMQRLGYAHTGEKRFRWLAATHLICGFLQTLSDQRLQLWTNLEAKSSDAGDTKKQVYQRFRLFCRKKQKKLAPQIYQVAKTSKKTVAWLKVLYAPGVAFTDQATNKPEEQVEKIYNRTDPFPSVENATGKGRERTTRTTSDEEQEKGKENGGKSSDWKEQIPEDARPKKLTRSEAQQKVEEAIDLLLHPEGRGSPAEIRSKAGKKLSRAVGSHFNLHQRYFQGTSLREIGREIQTWWRKIRDKKRKEWRKAAEEYEKKWYKKHRPLVYEFRFEKRPEWRKLSKEKRIEAVRAWIKKNRSKLGSAPAHFRSKVFGAIQKIQKKSGSSFESDYRINEITFRNVPKVASKKGSGQSIYVSLIYRWNGQAYRPKESSMFRSRKPVLVQTKGDQEPLGGVMTVYAYSGDADKAFSVPIAIKKVRSSKVDAMKDPLYRFHRSDLTHKTISLDRIDASKDQSRQSTYPSEIVLKREYENLDTPVPISSSYPYRRNGKWYVDLIAPKGTYRLSTNDQTVEKAFTWPPEDEYTESFPDRKKKVENFLKKVDKTVNSSD